MSIYEQWRAAIRPKYGRCIGLCHACPSQPISEFYRQAYAYGLFHHLMRPHGT